LSPLLQELRAKREATYASLSGLAARVAGEQRAFGDAEQSTYDTDLAELGRLDARIGELKASEDRQDATDAAFGRFGAGAGDHQAPISMRGYHPLASTGNRSWLPGWRHYRQYAEQYEQRDVAGTGSTFVPPEQATRWFDFLRAASVVLRAGPVQLDMHNLVQTVPKVTGAATAQMLAEGTAITEADPSLGVSTLTARKGTLFTKVNNEALDDSQPALQEVLSTVLTRDMATLVDKQLLTGNGTAPNVRGLLNITGATAVANGANGTQLSTQTNLDLFAGPVGTLQALNSDLGNCAWFVSPVLWSFVRRIKDSTGRYQLQNWGTAPSSDVATQLLGIPVYVTSNMPVNQTVGTSPDVSPVLLVDMTQVIVGMRRDIQLEMSRDFAFNQDQTALRLITRFDIQPVTAANTVVVNGLRAS
jgi:HK97 family phage major capsid protein